MKKSINILLNICIALIFITCIVTLSLSIMTLISSINDRAIVQEQLNKISVQDYMRDFINQNSGLTDSVPSLISEYKKEINTYNHLIIQNAVNISITTVATIAAVFVLVYCNPKLFRHSVYNKFAEDWAQNKAERAKQKKQARIAKLQAELEELKRDE